MSEQKFGSERAEFQEKNPDIIEILRKLAEGCSIHYFHPSGAPKFIHLYDKEGQPIDKIITENIFEMLQTEELIIIGENKDNSAGTQSYVISEKGRAYLE